MKRESMALEDKGTWDLVPLPPNKKAIGCKWVYKTKFLQNGQIDKYKARLVAKSLAKQKAMIMRRPLLLFEKWQPWEHSL